MDYKQRLSQDMQVKLTLSEVGGNTVPYQVGEAINREYSQDISSESVQALTHMWQGLLDAVIMLAEQPMDEQALGQAIKDLAMLQARQMGAGKKVFASRIIAEIPRLLNLPLLLEIARDGLKVPSLAAMERTDLPVSQHQQVVGGRSDNFAHALEKLRISSQSELTVFLSGETGSGKGLLARRLHDMSPRRNGPFVSVNCAALVSTLWESELFGHVKGAFTGATQNHQGYIRSAQDGTLFLDEIGESSLEFQTRLLSVLEERTVYPVGSSKSHAVNFRLISASHIPLEQLVQEKRFLPALMYRLLVLPIQLPPLRQRQEDLPALVEHFLQHACFVAKRTRALHPDTLEILYNYSWPGNIRQLMNIIQQLVTLSRNYQIMPEELPVEILNGTAAATPACPVNRRIDQAKLEINIRYHDNLMQLLTHLGQRQLSNRMLRQELGCSESTAKNILRCLVQHEVLRAYGQQGGRYYMLHDIDGK